MTKSIDKAPSTTATDNNVGDGSRTKNTKEPKQMHQVTKPLTGVIYLILRISFIIAIVTLMKMPQVHFIFDIPFYQIIGGIILLFLIYTELRQFFTSHEATTKGDKKKKQVSSSPLTDGLDYLQTPIK